jgi:hypothetical protein
MLEMFKSEELFFYSDECEFLDMLIYFLPNLFSIYSEFEQSSIFKSNEEFKMILFINIFMQFLYFSKCKMYHTIGSFNDNLKIAEDKGYFFVLSVNGS